MTWHLPPYAVAYLANALLATLACYFCWRHRAIPGAAALAFLMLAIVDWTLFQALEVMVVETRAKLLCAKLEYTGIASVGVLWLLFSARFSGQDGWITRKTMGLLWLIPVVTILAAISNEWHGLLWSSVTAGSPVRSDFLIYHHGPWFWVVISYSYATLLAGSFLLVRSIVKYPRLYRKQAVPLMLGVAVPWVGNLIYITGNSPVPGMDLTPFSFTIVGLIYFWSIFRSRLFEIVPIARDLLIENITDGVIVLDTLNRIVDLNPAARRFFGVTDRYVGRNAESLLGSLPPSVTHPSSFSVEHLEVTDERTTPRTFTFDIYPLIDRYDLPCGHLIMMRDVTEQKKAQEKLSESERRYREHVEEIGDIVYVLDANRNLKYVNTTLGQYIGYSRGDRNPKNFKEIVTPRSYNNLRNLFEKQGSGKKQRIFEVELGGAGNEVSVFEVSEKYITNRGGSVEIHGIGRNITERKRAEEAMRESEAKFRNVFETSRDFMYISSPDGKIIDYNMSAKDFFGYSDEEIRGMSILDFYHNPDDRTDLIEKLKARGYVENYELKLKKKDGSLIDALANIVVRTDSEGNIVGFQGSVRDITQMRGLEQQLMQAEKLSGLGTMISGVAHELNNPLTAIMGNAEFLLLRKTTPADSIKSLEVILKESERAAKIITGMLTFARNHKQERRMTSINEIIMESYKLREYNLKVSNIDVRLSLAGDLPPTYADPYQLQQVFTNIINNAQDALSGKRGGSLAIRSYLKYGALVIELEDDGPGIAEEDLKRIFDPFFTTKEVGKGTGLGLSMAYGIIEEHGGRIDVESAPGRGAKFIVSIPVVGSRRKEKEVVIGKKTELTGKRILIVDDEEHIRGLLSAVLSANGHIVKTSSSGQEALALIEKESFDAIIMDIKMPGMEGTELYAHIVNNYPGMGKRILFITGDTMNDDTQVFLKLTENKYIAKPFRIEALYTLLDEVLEH